MDREGARVPSVSLDPPMVYYFYRPQTKFGARQYFHKRVSRILFGGVLSQHALQVVSQHALQQVSGGSAPGGLLQGVPAPRGVCSGGVPGGDPPGQLLLRAVHILLECILVIK